MSAKVAALRCGSYSQAELEPAVERLLGLLGGLERFVSRGAKVLLKPNLLKASEPESCVTTHPALVKCLAGMVLEAGGKPFIGDSPAWGSLGRVAERAGLKRVAKEMCIPLVPFDHPVKVENRGGRVYRRLTLDRAVLEADVIINLPKLKTHQQLLLSGAIKNCFGCVPGKRKAWWHFKAGSYENYFALMLVEVFQLVRPTLNILDGVIAMEGNGPVNGSPRPLGTILASEDAVALDRILCHALGVEAESWCILAAAKELEAGPQNLEEIELVGEPLEAIAVPDFKLPRTMSIGFSLPRVVKSALKNQWIIRVEEGRTAGRSS
ncbi:MAG: DUF362 domain-containing protein [Nitrospinota bacterium]